MNQPQSTPAGPQNASQPVVVIIGGGFGGLCAALALHRAPAKVVLLDKTNHHLFQPLLYQVATSQLTAEDIAKPIRSILRDQENTTVAMSYVKEILPDEKIVVTTGRRIKYDYLIVAAGARHSYFGRDEWEQYAPGLKSMADAIDIRRRVLTAFEQAEKYEDDARRRSAMNFVIVGAGPTGVEMAGAISELAHTTLKSDFRRIDPTQTHVMLVEAGPRVLPTFTEGLSASALRQLQKLQVDVRLNTRVTGLGHQTVELNGEPMAAHTIIWAAGNNASPLARQIGAETDRAGRAMVNQDLTVPGHPEIQAIGDMCFVKDKKGKPVPGVAPAAMQMGRHAARNILRQLEGEAPKPFWYVDKGSLATIGRHAGIADLKGLRFGGWPAWLAWALIHLFFLIGFKNRVFVFWQWTWAYVTYSRGARLISEPPGSK